MEIPDRVLFTIVLLSLFLVVSGVFGLLWWLIRLHRQELTFYHLLLEGRNEDIARQAVALTEVEGRIQQLEQTLSPVDKPRLLRPNGDVA
jgi:hypothetical protein